MYKISSNFFYLNHQAPNVHCYKMKYYVSQIRTISWKALKDRKPMFHVPDEKRFDEAAKLKVDTYFNYPIKNKETFMLAITIYKEKRSASLMGHVNFIKGALIIMEKYGVCEDREAYMALLDIFPKGTMVAHNYYQRMSYHYSTQQHSGVMILAKMEDNRLIPDTQLQSLVWAIFGADSQPGRKLARSLYWLPKLRYISRWYLPDKLPETMIDIAAIAVKRMSTVDPTMKITVYNPNVEIKEGRILRSLPSRQIHKATDANPTATEVDKPDPDAPREEWIVSSISKKQRDFIKQHDINEALKVEGPFRIYLNYKCVSYFILRAEPKAFPPEKTEKECDDVSGMFNWIKYEGRCKEMSQRSVHEQDDGIILAICSTENSTRRSLLSWIRVLQKDSPELVDIPILFPQSSPFGEIITQDKSTKQDVKVTA